MALKSLGDGLLSLPNKWFILDVLISNLASSHMGQHSRNLSQPLLKGRFLAKMMEGCFLHLPVLSHCLRLDLDFCIGLELCPSETMSHVASEYSDLAREPNDLVVNTSDLLRPREDERPLRLSNDSFSRPFSSIEVGA